MKILLFQGVTRLLLTKIPYYKNVVLMSFSCEECGFENNEIQPGGAFAELGVRYVFALCGCLTLCLDPPLQQTCISL